MLKRNSSFDTSSELIVARYGHGIKLKTNCMSKSELIDKIMEQLLQ
jgi:RNA:NAD 2'-phosphotransferase (TPT1/KptA family)